MKSILEYKEKINLLLEQFFNQKISMLKGYPKDITHIMGTIKEFTLRKSGRIRPLLALTSYSMFKEITQEAERLSLTIELMQTSLLVQDDIMDNDDLRRGKPTVHKIYETYKGYSENIGMSIAILAGNIAALLIYELIEQADIDATTKIKFIKEINWILEREYYGQSLDILNAAEKIKKEDVLFTYELKTAAYTTMGPLALGAILAGAKEEEIRKLKACGRPLGLAFQIIDDLGSLFTPQEETGKTPYADLKEGKKTFIMTTTLERASAQEKEKINQGLGNRGLTQEEAEEIKQIIVTSGALEETKQYTEKLMREAEELAKMVQMRDQGKRYLNEIMVLLKEKLSRIQ